MDLTQAVEHVSDSCHTCASLRSVPRSLIEQSTSDPPDAIGTSFAADVLRRSKQVILVLRETVTSFTLSRIIDNEQHESLRCALACLCMELRPIDGPKAVIRVDPAPGFMALVDDKTLAALHIQLEIGRVKNINKNPVAERAIEELECEILKQEPGDGPVSQLTLAKATARLNSRIRSRGLSAREMLLQRSQFTNEQIPMVDLDLIDQQHTQRTINHPHSAKSKAQGHFSSSVPSLSVGDIVYLVCDRDKNKARDRYLVVSVDGAWCFIRKFTGAQLRSSSYKVKLKECYRVPEHRFQVVDHCVEESVTAGTHDDMHIAALPMTGAECAPTDPIPYIPPDIPT